MTARQVIAPDRSPTIELGDVAQLHQWAEQQRAEIVRLRLARRDAEADLVLAQSAMVGAWPGAEVPPAAFDAIDEMLANAHRDFERTIEVAQREARSIIAAARRVARDLVVDAAGWLDANDDDGPDLWLEPELELGGKLQPPRPARLLWNEVLGSIGPCPALPRPDDQALGTLEQAPGSSEIADHEAAQVYRVFWEQAERDRRLRDLFRRNWDGDAS